MDRSGESRSITPTLPPTRFLTSIIQLLWETDIFRKSFRSIKNHTNCEYTSCFFCALKSIFPNFQHHKYPGLPPNIVQRAATILQSSNAFSFESAALALSSLLSSLNNCLSNPLGQELFGIETDEKLKCECGYKNEQHSVLRYFLSVGMERFCLQTKALRPTDMLQTLVSPEYFTRLVRESIVFSEILPCPNHTKCSRSIDPSLQVVNSPPLLAVDVVWEMDADRVCEKLGILFDSLKTSFSLEDIFQDTDQLGAKRRYELCAMLCLLESREVLFTFHSVNQRWVMIDPESVKLADGTFSQLLFYLKQNLYFPTLLLYSDPDYIDSIGSVPVRPLPLLASSSSSEESRSLLSNAWRDEEQNTSIWKEGNSSYLQHITDSLQSKTALTDDTRSYGYLDFGLATCEPHAGFMDLNPQSVPAQRLNPMSEGRLNHFQPTKVVVHSSSIQRLTPHPNLEDVMSSCSDPASLSPNPAPLRPYSKRSTSQKHVPSIPTPFALLWELEVFRKSLQTMRGHVCTLKTCVFCVYQLIMERFEYKDIPVVPPELLRRVMAICFEGQEGYNLGLSFDGIHKTYEELLIRIHYNLTGIHEVSSCNALHCLTHQKFASNFTLRADCECGHSLDPFNSLELVYSISAQSLIEESRNISNSNPNLSTPKEFGTKLKLIGALQDTQPCPNPSCKAPLRIHRTLTNKPDVFTISLNWDGLPITSQNLKLVINSIGTSICLGDVFEHTQPFLKFRPYYLTAIVARNDPKYAFFFNHSTLHAWYCLDDSKITTLGDKWTSVVNTLQSLPYQAILLVYIDPIFSELHMDSALTETVFAPEAEGEKIRKEFLFPQITDSISSCVNLRGSPESIYSSDAELFNWNAGERLSYRASISDKNFYSQNLDSENELDSSLVIHEEVGTFRIVEGADGDKRTFIDLISSSPEVFPAEETWTTPPGLLLLWQLDVFRNTFTGITEHKCEGVSCIVCILKTVQHSTDPFLPSQTLKGILFDQPQLPNTDQVATYHFNDILTRLHNCLCTDSATTGAADLCKSVSCASHQKFSLHLGVSEVGQSSQDESFFFLELSGPELIRRIRNLNKVTSQTAGSVRVMRLFTQATRSLLEQSNSRKRCTLSLLNEPEIICLSLNWNGEPSREEVTEFYELISTAIQPSDLFHHTQNKYVAKRVYYLLGIVTQGPSSYETWFYHQKHRSWTHLSGRTSSVSQLGPQLSLVWHSCKASSNTYAPVFLLYSNPSVCSPSQGIISPLPSVQPTAPSKHPSHYSTLTPSKPLFHEDYVVISSERNRVSSAQQGVDEALSFLDATIKYEEMNLTPSPASSLPIPMVSVKSSSLERGESIDSETFSVISDNNAQISSNSPLFSSLSDRPFSTSIFSPINFKEAVPVNVQASPDTDTDMMEHAERLSIVIFSLLQINLFRLSLLQIHDDVLDNTPYLALKQLFHVVIFAPHLISSKFIPIACQHFGFLSNVRGQTSTDLYNSFLSNVISNYPMNPFSNYLRNTMMMQIQHEERTIYTQTSLPVSANRMVILLKSHLVNTHSPLSFDKLFSSLVRQALTCDNTGITLLNSPDIVPIHLQWDPNVMNSPETEYLVDNISPVLLFSHLFPVVANQTISQRILYLYGMIVSINQIQLILYFTNDIKSWILYDGSSFQVIGYIWQDVLYFLQSNHCRPDLLFYTNPAANLLDASPLQRGLPEISHTKCNSRLNEIAVPILKELLDQNQLNNSKSSSCHESFIQDTVKEVEMQGVLGSPIRIVLSNAGSLDNLNAMVNLGSLDKLDIISIGSNYESSLQRRVNKFDNNDRLRKPTPVLSRPTSSTSPFRREARASYHPFFTSLVVLWSIDLFRETLLRLEMILKTPDYIPLIIRIKEVFTACDHSAELTPVLPLFQNLSSQLLKHSKIKGNGTEVFDTVLTLLKDELRKSINFHGPDPIGKSRLIQNIFTITIQESGKCRCGATYAPIEVKRNLLHLNLELYLPHVSKACNKYGNINIVPKLAHKAIRDTLFLMSKRDCKSQSCNRTYLSNSLLVTAPRIVCFALDYEHNHVNKTNILSAIPTSLRIDKLFKEIGPNARANSLLYLTGIMAEISRERVVHMYYHSAVETWISVDGMGYKEVGGWSHVIEEIEGLSASPVSLVYTNPLDISHQYRDPALVFPVSEIIRTMSAPNPPSLPKAIDQNEFRRRAGTKEDVDIPHYVTIEDINLNKKRKKENQSLRTTAKSNPGPPKNAIELSDSSSSTANRAKPPLPFRLAPSKESIAALERTEFKPAFESGEFSSVSDLSTATAKSHPQGSYSQTSKSESNRSHPDGTKVKNKHKKASSVTLLNKLNPKTYFKKKDKIRFQRVEQTTREFTTSELANSPRLSEILETPKPNRLTNRDGSYTEHLNELFSRSPVNNETLFVSEKSLEGKNLGLFDSVVQELELKTSPPKLDDTPQPRPRHLHSNSAVVPQPRGLPRSHKDPFESSIAAHILLQMINFPAYSQTVLNFSRLPMKKHQIIQALSILFKRAASTNTVNKADIVEYLNTCMPSMLSSSDFDTGHRLFHQLHWSFQPHSETFKEHYSLQIKGKDNSQEDVYFMRTTINDWLIAMEKPLSKRIPATYNHKLMREGLRKLFRKPSRHILNSPDQFYVAIKHDTDVDVDSAFRIWHCVPASLRLGDLFSSVERKLSQHKPFYLTGIIARSGTGSLISYSYSDVRGLWYSFDPSAHNDNNLNHWEELLSYVTTHSIFPIALLYTSPQSLPLFSRPLQEVAPTLSHATQTSLPRQFKQPDAVSESSHSQSSSLHRMRYHTLTPHPSVSSTDISRNLPVHLLSTLLLNQGFTASVQSLPDDSCPAIRDLRNLILATFRTFSSRQHSVTTFAEQNLGDVGGESPYDIYQELLSKLIQRNPSLKSKLYLSVADRNGEEAIASVKVSLSGFMSQVAHIPQFSKLNPKKCKIALKPASSIGKKQIQNAANLLSLYVGDDGSNGETIGFLPSLLRLSYLGTVNPKCYFQHDSYYLTGIILTSGDGSYTSAVFLAPRNRWLLLEVNSLSDGQELTWSQLCDSLHSSPLSPVFCFYSNSNIMGQYSVSLPPLSTLSSQSNHFMNISSQISNSTGQHGNEEELPFMTSPTSPLIDFSFTQREDFFDFRSDDLTHTSALTDMNPPLEIYQPALQSNFDDYREDSPLLTFPPPPEKSPSPTIFIYSPEQNHSDFNLDIPTLQQYTSESEQGSPLFISGITMLWHIPFFRHAILLAPGHTCVGFSCALCALKSLFALYYYSRSFALSSDAINLAKKHGFGSTEDYQSIGELIPAIVKLTDNTLKSGRYRLMSNFILGYDQGSLTVLPVSLSLLCENMMKLAKTEKFSRLDHPLLFSKALSNTLQFRQQVVSTPNVLILDFREQVELQTGSYLGNYINLSDLVITRKRNNCFTTHFYLSSVFTTDRTGGYATFSFHSELSIWIGYNGHNVIQFTTFDHFSSYLANRKLTLLSCLYLNPSTLRPAPQDLPQQIVRAPEAVGESATIRRMQQAEEESTRNKSSLYPSIPHGIDFDNLLEDYERNKQGIGKKDTPPNANASAPFFPLSQQIMSPPQMINSLALPPSINPNYQAELAPSYPDGSSFPATHHLNSLFTPPVNLAYPPFIFPSVTSQAHLQYPPPLLQDGPRQQEVVNNNSGSNTFFSKLSFSTFPHSGKLLSTQAVTKLSAELTESGHWMNLFQSIPCIGESYEINAFQQRQKQTNFSPGRVVLERIHDYQIPMEVLLEAFTQTDFQEGIDLLMDPKSYSSEITSVSPLSSSLITPDESSSEDDEEYNPDLSSVNTELAPNSPALSSEEATTPETSVEDVIEENEELNREERELLQRKHSEEGASLLRDYQEKIKEQEARQKRERESLNNLKDQNPISGDSVSQDTNDVPEYVPPPALTNAPSLDIPAYPSSFPPTKADMFYTQARDLYRESLNISDFSVAFSLCVQAQNKLDLAMIEPDVRLDPAKKQAYSQLRHTCHQQAVKLHRRSVLKTIDPNHQFKSPAKKQSNGKTKRVKFDSTIEEQEENGLLVEEQPQAPLVYTRPVLRPPPLTPSLYQSIPRPPPIGRAMLEEDKENKKPQHKIDYPPSRQPILQAPPLADSPTLSDSTPSTPSTFSTISDDMTSSSSSRTSSRSRKREQRRDLPPTRPFFNENHYTILDQFIRHRRDNIPQGLDHSELSRKLLNSKINSRSLSLGTNSPSTVCHTPDELDETPSPREYFKFPSASDKTSTNVVPKIPIEGTHLVPEKCTVCRSDKFFTIKTMCPDCYTRYIRSTELMLRSGADPTDV